MSSKSAISLTKRQEVQEKAGQITSVLEEYLKPLVEPLDAYLDKRWVRTLFQWNEAQKRYEELRREGEQV
jgi:hypothetical protein